MKSLRFLPTATDEMVCMVRSKGVNRSGGGRWQLAAVLWLWPLVVGAAMPPTDFEVNPPLPVEEVVREVPSALFDVFRFGQPGRTAPREVRQAHEICAAMQADEALDETERAVLGALIRPEFRLRLQAQRGGEVVFVGTFLPEARAKLAALLFARPE